MYSLEKIKFLNTPNQIKKQQSLAQLFNTISPLDEFGLEGCSKVHAQPKRRHEEHYDKSKGIEKTATANCPLRMHSWQKPSLKVLGGFPGVRILIAGAYAN